MVPGVSNAGRYYILNLQAIFTHMSKFIGVSVSGLLALAALAPSLAMAQTGNGLLSVYVQVVNPFGGVSRNPGDFQVQVMGQSPSPATFWGSQTGVSVSLNPGTYSVALSGNQWGYTPSYSQGCNATMAAGGTGLCVITVSPNYTNYPYPSPYPYPYTQPSLSCQPAHQTAGLRQNVQFTATGGVGGTYNWQVPGRSYPNAGPVLTVAFEQSGSQLVTVTNGPQSATCEITISSTYNPVLVTNPIYPTLTPAYPNYSGYPGTQPTVTSSYYPRLPNTGFEPMTAAQVALVLSLLGAAAALGAPYIRKAFVLVTR